MNRRFQRILILAILAAAAIVFRQDKILKNDPGNARIAVVIDGDTLKLTNGKKVRLIGIDCPESGYNQKLYRDAKRTGEDIQTILELGRRAKEFTATTVDDKDVRLEFDAQPRDKYGRLLAYVFIQNNGTELFLNSYLVEQGYANLMTIPPNVKYADLFKELYRQARKNNRGLWEK